MEANTHQETIQRIAHELASMGQKSDITLTEEQISVLIEKCLAAIDSKDAQQLLSLSNQVVLSSQQNRRPEVTEVRPQVLECDVVRFQNNKEKWVALVGLLDGYPYEIFTGLQDDEEGIILPKNVAHGKSSSR